MTAHDKLAHERRKHGIEHGDEQRRADAIPFGQDAGPATVRIGALVPEALTEILRCHNETVDIVRDR